MFLSVRANRTTNNNRDQKTYWWRKVSMARWLRSVLASNSVYPKTLTDRKWERRCGMFGAHSESIDCIRDEIRLDQKAAWVSWIRQEEQKRYGAHNASLIMLIGTQIGLCAVYPRR